MTDFTPADQRKPADSPTKDEDGGGGTPNPASEADDKTVVLEYDGRKFTKPELVKKLAHADNFIDTLKQESTEQRKLLESVNETLKKQVSAAELLKQLKENGVVQPPPVDGSPKPITSQDVADTVLAQLAQQKAEEQRNANWEHVTSELFKRFGEATNERVREVAKEAGFSLEEAAEFAKSKPKAFLRLFPEKASPSSPFPKEGARNTQSFQAGLKPPSSGYTKASSTKDKVQAYLNRLQELSEG